MGNMDVVTHVHVVYICLVHWYESNWINMISKLYKCRMYIGHCLFYLCQASITLYCLVWWAWWILVWTSLKHSKNTIDHIQCHDDMWVRGCPLKCLSNLLQGASKGTVMHSIVTHYSFLRCCDMPPRMPKRINKHVAKKTPISLSPSNFRSGPSKNFVFLISRRVERAFCNCFDSIPTSTSQSPSWSCHHSSISLIHINFRFQW
jgi:hypothetical protein